MNLDEARKLAGKGRNAAWSASDVPALANAALELAEEVGRLQSDVDRILNDSDAETDRLCLGLLQAKEQLEGWHPDEAVLKAIEVIDRVLAGPTFAEEA